VIAGLLMAAGAVALFLYEYYTESPRVGHEHAAREAQTLAVTTVILFQVFYVLNCRSLRDSILKIGLFSNKAVYAGIGALLLLQGAFIYVPALNSLFGSVPLSLGVILQGVLVASTILPIITIEKWLRSRRR